MDLRQIKEVDLVQRWSHIDSDDDVAKGPLWIFQKIVLVSACIVVYE